MIIMNKAKKKRIIYDDVNCLQAISYCFKHNIRIYPVPKNQKEYYLNVYNNGIMTRSPCTYKLNEWSDKVFELYLFYYYKHNPK